MYLSRLVLNTGLRAVRADLADCQAMHRRVMSAFPDGAPPTGPRAALGVLYRVETSRLTGGAILLVQSHDEPDWSRLPVAYLDEGGDQVENATCKVLDAAYGAIETGSRLRFRLRANPTRKIDTRSGPDGQRRNGRRVELRDESARIDWLQRKGRQGGFEILSVRMDSRVPDVLTHPEAKVHGNRPAVTAEGGEVRKARLTLRPVLFEGELKVTDAGLFRTAIETGIGPGKAYGLGLLSVAPAGR